MTIDWYTYRAEKKVWGENVFIAIIILLYFASIQNREKTIFERISILIPLAIVVV